MGRKALQAEQHGRRPSGWRVASEEGLGGNWQQESGSESLRGAGSSLGFLLRALGSQERVLSKAEERMCNSAGPLWLPRGHWELMAREQPGPEPGASGMISTQFRLEKPSGEDPEAYEGAVSGRREEPGLSDTSQEKESWVQRSQRAIWQYLSNYL